MPKHSRIKLITKTVDGESRLYKECTLCAEVKELNEFSKSSKGIGGRYTRCKKCVTGIYRAKNGEPTRYYVFKKDGKLVKKCTKCHIEKTVDNFYPKRNSYESKCIPYYLSERRKGTGPKVIEIVVKDGNESKECRDCEEVKPLKDFPKTNGKGIGGVLPACNECMSIRRKRYREDRRESAILASRKWRLSNREKQLESQKKWRERNKDKDLIYRATRKARKKFLRDDLTADQWQEIIFSFNNSCALSKDTDITMDHFIPISFGGGTCLGNVYPLSSKLNYSKHNRNPFEWYEVYGKMHGVKENEWNKLIDYLSGLNRMSPAEFKEYVDSLFEDGEMYGTTN